MLNGCERSRVWLNQRKEASTAVRETRMSWCIHWFTTNPPQLNSHIVLGTFQGAVYISLEVQGWSLRLYRGWDVTSFKCTHSSVLLSFVHQKKKKKQKTQNPKYRMWQIKQGMCMYSETVKCCVNIRDSYSLLLCLCDRVVTLLLLPGTAMSPA